MPPHVVLGRKELDPVEDNANVILNKPAFATARSEWDFILVSASMNDVAHRRIKDDRDDGRFGEQSGHGKARVRAFVRTWGDFIAENNQRLDSCSRGPELDPSVEDGLRHLHTTYAELLPPGWGSAIKVPHRGSA